MNIVIMHILKKIYSTLSIAGGIRYEKQPFDLIIFHVYKQFNFIINDSSIIQLKLSPLSNWNYFIVS